MDPVRRKPEVNQVYMFTLSRARILRTKGKPEEAAPGQELRLSLLSLVPRGYEALYSDRRAEEVKKWIKINGSR